MREAQPTDAPVVAAIHSVSFPASEAWGADAIALQLALPGTFGFLDPDGGMILCRLAGDEAEILTFAVQTATRRRGIGSQLLREAMSAAAAGGALRIFLEVSEGNQAARNLYLAAGFRTVGRRRVYYADGTDALVMMARPHPARCRAPTFPAVQER
ncbi:MAG: GNAT family N-acetyltransferase [Acetobacteraceae bacterium]|nr:GNAT family N-acetyltransferase [Acetobacteraceae bacterium]